MVMDFDFIPPLRQPRKPKPKQEPTPAWIKERYNQAHEQWFKVTYPQAYQAGHYTPPNFPDVSKANGLTRAVVNYINWIGGNATRISSAGRYAGGKWIPSTTRRGKSDISGTIKGRSIQIEIKVGSDKPSPHQLAEQQREIKAGGLYFFTHSMQEFFNQIDSL